MAEKNQRSASRNGDAESVIYEIQAYQAQAQMLQQQLQQLQAAAADISGALEALKGIEAAKDGAAMMLPLGSGALIRARIEDRNRVFVDIGAGIAAEKTLAEATEFFKKKSGDIEALRGKMNAALAEAAAHLRELEPKAREIAARSGESP
jgi:prefoldin alpha subunit